MLGRRQFVHGVTGVLTGALGALHPFAVLAPSRAWAVELHTLSMAESATLLGMIHTIAPHDGLDEAAYALVVGALDADASTSGESRGALTAGLAGLGADFAPASELERPRNAGSPWMAEYAAGGEPMAKKLSPRNSGLSSPMGHGVQVLSLCREKASFIVYASSGYSRKFASL